MLKILIGDADMNIDQNEHFSSLYSWLVGPPNKQSAI